MTKTWYEVETIFSTNVRIVLYHLNFVLGKAGPILPDYIQKSALCRNKKQA